ncbi:MAG: hypothetical protein IIA62_10200, partial [Nitrospinae bacterium]|nr:hypothetical protein [Nitrospinota bacterium]
MADVGEGDVEHALAVQRHGDLLSQWLLVRNRHGFDVPAIAIPGSQFDHRLVGIGDDGVATGVQDDRTVLPGAEESREDIVQLVDALSIPLAAVPPGQPDGATGLTKSLVVTDHRV